MLQDEISPVFIIGSYRSGTSVTTWCLGQHPNIWVLPETYWIAKFAENLETLYQMGTAQPAAHFARCGITEDDFIAEARDFVNRVVRRGQEIRIRKVLTYFQSGGVSSTDILLQRAPLEPKKRWVDGTPENSHYVGHLLKLFPGAKFIHLVRSPHEVVRSLYKFDQAWSGARPQEAVDGYATWRRLAGAAFEAEQAFGSDVVHRFYHADLVSNPEGALRSMLRWSGERFRPECLTPLAERMNSSNVEGDAVFSAESVPSSLKATFEDNEAFFVKLRDTKPLPKPSSK
jgi:hypothetical protein